MDSSHLFQTFAALLGLIAFVLVVATVLAILGHLSEALLLLLTNAMTGCFTLLRNASPRSVTVDNPPSNPVPTAEAQ